MFKKHKLKLQQTRLETLRNKCIIYSFLVLLGITISCLIPKNIINSDKIYYKAVTMAELKDENDLVYKTNKIYLSEDKFNSNMLNDIQEKTKEFKDNNSILVVKSKGNGEPIYYKDYIMVFDPKLVPLDLEFFALKGVRYKNNVIPTETAISGALDIVKKINTVAYPSILVGIGITSLCFCVSSGFILKEIIQRKNNKN